MSNHTGQQKAGAEFEHTPQELVANRMFGTRRDIATNDDISFLRDHLPGWSVQEKVNVRGVRTVFEKGARAATIDNGLLVISRKICTPEDIAITPTSDTIKVSLPSELSPRDLARIAMVDFSIDPPKIPQEKRYERMAVIIGRVDRNKIGQAGEQPNNQEVEKPEQIDFDFLTNCKVSEKDLEKISLLTASQVDLLSDTHLPYKEIAMNNKCASSTIRGAFKKIKEKLGTENPRDLIALSIGSGMSNITNREIELYRSKDIKEVPNELKDVFSYLMNGFGYDDIQKNMGLRSRHDLTEKISALYKVMKVSNKKECILAALFNDIDIFPELPKQR